MSEEISAILSLPYILPAQAQKHVTHNEALRILDVLVQLVVTSRNMATPPSTPWDGARYIVPPGATGAFSNHVAEIAVWQDNNWQFFRALPGWQAEVLDEEIRVVFNGTEWLGPEARPHEVLELGVATQADATNRLAVASDATLLTHAGNGHQLKINKAAAADTASLLFQTGWSGRAEMGTVGEDAFSIKTSADGSTFHTVLRAQPLSGRVDLPSGSAIAPGSATAPGMAFLGDSDTGLFSPEANAVGLSVAGQAAVVLTPAGLSVNVPVTGLAVTQSNIDTTTGRLTKVGDGGILGNVPISGGAQSLRARNLPGGLWGYSTLTTPQHPDSGVAWPHAMLTMRVPGTFIGGGGDVGTYLTGRVSTSAAGLRLWWGVDSAVAGEINWAEIITNRRLVGTVSQSGGLPTGAVIERGNNANGEFVRFADGTQMCTFAMVASSSADTTWTYPAAFAVTPAVSLSCSNAGGPNAIVANTSGGPGMTSVAFNLWTLSNTRIAQTARLLAIGRWF